MSGGAVATLMLRFKDDVPLILVSGSSVPQEDLALFNRFIPKGGPPNVLLSAIEEVLSAGEQTRTSKRLPAEPPDHLYLASTTARNEPWILHI